MKRAGRVAALMLVLTFTVGSLAGMAIEEAVGIDWFEFLDDDDDNDGNPRLTAGLGLTSDQTRQIDAIVDRQEDQLEDYWESRMPEIQAILDKNYAEIRALLTPSQQALFDRRVRELDGQIPEEFRD
jgi:Spy/CpxP family protein refolding chaperone